MARSVGVAVCADERNEDAWVGGALDEHIAAALHDHQPLATSVSYGDDESSTIGQLRLQGFGHPRCSGADDDAGVRGVHGIAGAAIAHQHAL